MLSVFGAESERHRNINVEVWGVGDIPPPTMQPIPKGCLIQLELIRMCYRLSIQPLGFS